MKTIYANIRELPRAQYDAIGIIKKRSSLKMQVVGVETIPKLMPAVVAVQARFTIEQASIIISLMYLRVSYQRLVANEY